MKTLQITLVASMMLSLAAGCSDSEPPTGGGDATIAEDATADEDAGLDAEVPDAGEVDAGEVLDAGEADSGINNFPTLADYRTCRSDTDCPIGLGACVKTLAFNRPDINGLASVTLADVYAGLNSGEGVCSRNCTLDISACDGLMLRDAAGEPVPYTCQVVATGTTTYPNWQPAFPFDDRLDFSEQALGQPFAAMCRPPFQLDASHSDDFCAPCDVNTPCDGLCYRFDAQAVVTSSDAPGLCLSRAPVDGCPMGFEARDIDGQGAVCAPLSETCGPCLDRDGDGHGAGHCSAIEIDCDDSNPAAYYSQAEPEHPFPTHCGGFDHNCNGRADDAEQVGIEAYAPFHCEFCGDNADGRRVLVGTDAEATLECVAGVVRPASCAVADRVHCVGDVRAVGCETGATGGQIFFRDVDGDMFGDPNVPVVGCPSGGPPSGAVVDNTDCNDSDREIRPGAADRCECWGDCGQPMARVDNNCNGTFDEDVTNYRWGPDLDADGAAGASTSTATYCGAPFMGAVISNDALGEDCADTSSTAYGAHVRILDASLAPLGLPVLIAPPRDASGELFTGAVAAFAEVCDQADNNCNGQDDEGVQTTYYRDADGDTWGDDLVTVGACSLPGGYVGRAGDCNDSPTVGATRYPGAPEVCNGADDSCNGQADVPAPPVPQAVGHPFWTGGQFCNAAVGNPTRQGDCQLGELTACTNGAFPCRSINPPHSWDDPDIQTTVGAGIPASFARVGDANCDGVFGPKVYVRPTGVDTPAGGTRTAPLRTIAYALQQAAPGSQIYLQGNQTYNEANLQLTNGTDIVGGWSVDASNNWSCCSGKSTILVAANAGGAQRAAVRAVGLTVRPTLSRLNINVQAQPTAANYGNNSYGIVAENGLGPRLHDVSIVVASGQDAGATTPNPPGLEGVNGSAGPGGEHVGGAQACLGTNVSGGDGGGGIFGAGGGPGFGPNPATISGFPGGDGAGGAGGGPRSDAIGYGGVIPGGWSGGFANGGTFGGHGSGGAGGAGFPGGLRGGGGGSGGCGGYPGGVGYFGGSAFGLFSINSSFEFIQPVAITVGGGGDGSAAQPGTSGGNWGVGSPPTVGGPGFGGRGGAGGGGGGGGGGNGGSSYVIFHAGAADVCGSIPAFVGRSFTAGTTVGSGGGGGIGGLGGAGYIGQTLIPKGGVVPPRNGVNGAPGRNGFRAACFWSRPCGAGCTGTGEVCGRSNYCIRP